MQVVAAGVANTGMDALDFGLRLLPVLAEFYFAAHRLLRLAQLAFLSFKAVERLQVATVAQGGKAGNAHINTHRPALRDGLLDFTLGLDGHEPLAARLANCDSFVQEFMRQVNVCD